MMPLSPLSVHDLTEAVLACVCAHLEETAAQTEGQPGCPCRTCVVPGAVAFDSCEDPCSGEAGGQLTVSLARLYPASPSDFPAEDRTVRGLRGCPGISLNAAELIVTLLRCAPIGDDNGCPPTCEELAAAARVMHIDAVTVQTALLCCFPATAPSRRGRRFVLGPQRTIGPQGGCVGVEQRVTIALPGCASCPGEDSPS